MGANAVCFADVDAETQVAELALLHTASRVASFRRGDPEDRARRDREDVWRTSTRSRPEEKDLARPNTVDLLQQVAPVLRPLHASQLCWGFDGRLARTLPPVAGYDMRIGIGLHADRRRILLLTYESEVARICADGAPLSEICIKRSWM